MRTAGSVSQATADAVELVPTWLPLRVSWVYLTGAGHVAAGLAILIGVVPRLAAVLEAATLGEGPPSSAKASGVPAGASTISCRR